MNIVKRFFGWLFSWQTMRRLLIGVAALATLIAIFYTEENWRGKRAWENYKHKLEAKGEVFDWNAYIPPPVPDDQNFFKAPKMAQWFVKKSGQRQPGKTELSERLSNPETQRTITNAAAAARYLSWSDQFEPDLNLIREGLKRPYARMDGNYERPYEIPIPHFITVRTVAQTLAQRARCELMLKQPEKALRDLELMNDLRHLMEGAPTGKPMTIVAAMINVAVGGLYADTIADGLRTNSWSEPQLAALQKQLSEMNLIPPVAEAFASERVATTHTVEILKQSELTKAFFGTSKNWSYWIVRFMPRGWIYQNMRVHVELSEKFVGIFEPENQRVNPRKAMDGQHEVEAALKTYSPFKYVASVSIPNYWRAFQSLARNQTSANEAQIVCALERYRLAKKEYPETLDALTPQFIEKIPHDIIGGEPLKYRLADDSFVLYSVGWNETDDDGKVVLGKDGKEDREKGDWVWRYAAK